MFSWQKMLIIKVMHHRSILQWFWPALSDYRSWKHISGSSFEWLLKIGFSVYMRWISFFRFNTFCMFHHAFSGVTGQSFKISFSATKDWLNFLQTMQTMRSLHLVHSCLLVCLVWFFMSQSTAMVMSAQSVHLTILFSWASLTKRLTSTSCSYFRL